jgi:hypothetical protein
VCLQNCGPPAMKVAALSARYSQGEAAPISVAIVHQYPGSVSRLGAECRCRRRCHSGDHWELRAH